MTGQVAGGRLELVWAYSAGVHRPATVTALAEDYLQALEALIDHCCQAGPAAPDPADFPLAGLNQRALDSIRQRLGPPPAPARPRDQEVDHDD